MKYITCLVLVLALTFPASIFAQTSLLDQPIVMELKKDQKAPYDGVFLNAIAAAQMLTDKKYTAEECGIEIDYELSKEKARCNLSLESLQASLDSAESKYISLLDIKDQEIDRLQKMVEDSPSDYYVWWLTGGVLAGIALTVGVFAIAVEIKNN